MLGGRSLRPWLLLLTAALLFVAECRIFHYPLATGLDALGLFALILVPSYAFVWIGARLAGLRLSFPFSASDVLVMLNAVLVFFALYNLQQFHFMPDGGILTRGLFGVDIPWLAGEVHGLRIFGELRDLHQAAQPWQYHDATYRLLALFPRERTLADLAFAAPLVGYTLLAVSVFVLVMRVTARRAIAWFAVAAWFLVSGWAGLDQSSYALSPSFVFGSVIFLNVLLLLDIRSKHEYSARIRFVLNIAIVLLLILLMETKLTSFLVLTGSLALLAMIESLRRHWRNSIEFFVIAVAPVVIFALQSRPNPMMPAGDFLIGAPLMGYANHVAALLRVPVSAVSPVTHGLTLEWRSLLIIPYFAFHVGRFVVTDPRILAAIIMLIFVGRKLVTGEHLSRDVAWLLALTLPLGFLIPVLYSPSWYPLALSFYAPLVSTQAAVLVVAVGIGILWNDRLLRHVRITLVLCGLLVACGFVKNSCEVIQADRSKASLVTGPIVDAMAFLGRVSSDTAMLATSRHDFITAGDESYYWCSALSGHPVVSEGAKYGALLAAVADTDAPKGLHRVPQAEQLLHERRALLDTIYGSLDPGRVEAALKEARVAYLVEDGIHPSHETQVSHWSIGEKVFSNEACTIWKVRP